MKKRMAHPGAGRILALTLLLLVLGAPPAWAQGDLEALAAACASGVPALQGPCGQAAAAVRSTSAGLGLLASGGSEVPGSASTLGRRMRASPRFALSARVGSARLRTADIRAAFPSPEASSLGWTVQGHAAVGVFQGFSVLPTVGGILSLDLTAGAGVLLLPASDGYRQDVGVWGVGARLGLLRESFTLPGVSVSLAYRGLGEVENGARDAAGDPVGQGASRVDGAVTSVRATVGKDLLGAALMVGLGWDRYSGEGEIAVRSPGVTGVVGEGRGEFDDARTAFFGGIGFTFLVLQVSGEVGWAGGFDRLPASVPSGGLDPTQGAFFAGLALRLTI